MADLEKTLSSTIEGKRNLKNCLTFADILTEFVWKKKLNETLKVQCEEFRLLRIGKEKQSLEQFTHIEKHIDAFEVENCDSENRTILMGIKEETKK